MTESLNPPLADYTTQQARADEQRRRKLRRELLAQWQAARGIMDAETVAAIRGITDNEWATAQAQDEGEAQ